MRIPMEGERTEAKVLSLRGSVAVFVDSGFFGKTLTIYLPDSSGDTFYVPPQCVTLHRDEIQVLYEFLTSVLKGGE